jgi:signal transduction histidine kinase
MIAFRKNHFYKLAILKQIILVTVLVNIYLEYNPQPLIMISLFSLSIIIFINGYIRNLKLKRESKLASMSLFFSIFFAAILQHFAPGASTTFYMYCILFEIFLFPKNKLKLLISVHAFMHFSVNILNILIYNTEFSLFSFGIQILAYSGTAGMLYNQKILEIEKEEIKQLNEKLKLSNIKLQEYALEVEEVTISKERTRLAQELHDSLGHSLMALAMHLEFAKKICIAKPQKVEEVLEQSEKIAKSSIIDLRKAVTLLNSEVEISDLDTSIEKLINNFYLVSNLKFTYTKNRNINDLSSLIKTSIYKTIQECITNSLKHGNATEINIKITVTNENVEFIITDNGIGCNDIVKSNGLKGIEHRIQLLGGSTNYFSHNDLGFGIKVFIPL